MNMTAYDERDRMLYSRYIYDDLHLIQTVLNSALLAVTKYVIFKGRKYDIEEIKSTRKE